MSIQPYHWFEVIAFITSLVMFKKIYKTPLAYFPLFLLVTLIYESASLLGVFTVDTNHRAASIFTLFEFLFYGFIFYQILISKQNKIVLVITYTIFFILCLINIIYYQGTRFNSYSTLAGTMLTVAWICLFFYKIINTELNTSLVKYPVFWIITGVFLFYVGQFILMSYFESLAYIKKDVKDCEGELYALVYYIVMNTLNIIMYFFFSIAFLCSRLVQKL